jgi:hypothetical protein
MKRIPLLKRHAFEILARSGNETDLHEISYNLKEEKTNNLIKRKRGTEKIR